MGAQIVIDLQSLIKDTLACKINWTNIQDKFEKEKIVKRFSREVGRQNRYEIYISNNYVFVVFSQDNKYCKKDNTKYLFFVDAQEVFLGELKKYSQLHDAIETNIENDRKISDLIDKTKNRRMQWTSIGHSISSYDQKEVYKSSTSKCRLIIHLF